MQNALIRLLLVTNVALLIVAAAPKKPAVLKLSELDIVDSNGTIRARLGGDLPDAVVDGKVRPRGSKAAGLLVYDKAGQERGGYVTFANDHAALTLDSKKEMTAILVAGPTGTSALTLRDGGSVIDIRSDRDDGPHLHALQDGHVVFHVPQQANFEKNPACAELREALKKNSREQVLAWCRDRNSDEACQACLGGQ